MAKALSLKVKWKYINRIALHISNGLPDENREEYIPEIKDYPIALKSAVGMECCGRGFGRSHEEDSPFADDGSY